MEAAFLLTTVWCLILAGAQLELQLGWRSAALAWSCAALLLLASRPRRREPSWLPVLILGGIAGYASLPAWIVLISVVGLSIGFVPLPSAPPSLSLERFWVGVVCAPIVEELLYRERVLVALEPRIGTVAAVLVSSMLFALPHLDGWSVLGTLLVGIGLGSLAAARGGIALCIGIHAGLNLALLANGSPPTRNALPPLLAACVGLLVTALAFLLTRPVRRRHRV